MIASRPPGGAASAGGSPSASSPSTIASPPASIGGAAMCSPMRHAQSVTMINVARKCALPSWVKHVLVRPASQESNRKERPMKPRGVHLVAAAWLCCAACAQDGVGGDDGGDDAPDADPTRPDAEVGDSACDMSGRWIAEQHTISVALSSDQHTTNYYLFDITQEGDV